MLEFRIGKLPLTQTTVGPVFKYIAKPGTKSRFCCYIGLAVKVITVRNWRNKQLKRNSKNMWKIEKYSYEWPQLSINNQLKMLLDTHKAKYDEKRCHHPTKFVWYRWSPNSTWLVTSRLDTTRQVRRVARVETSVSSRAVRQARHSQSAWPRRVERVVSCRDVTWRAKWNLGLRQLANSKLAN